MFYSTYCAINISGQSRVQPLGVTTVEAGLTNGSWRRRGAQTLLMQVGTVLPRCEITPIIRYYCAHRIYEQINQDTISKAKQLLLICLKTFP